MKKLALVLTVMTIANAQATPSTVTIENTGSTNTSAYRIVLEENGSATLESHRKGQSVGAPVTHTVSKELAARLFADVHKAMPLSKWPARHLIKSASFGTATFVEFAGERSPDLEGSAASEPELSALQADVKAIVAAVKSP